MNFYNTMHPYYCGIDLHAKTLYVCVLDQEGGVCLHREISTNPAKLQALLEPYLGNVVVGVAEPVALIRRPAGVHLYNEQSRLHPG